MEGNQIPRNSEDFRAQTASGCYDLTTPERWWRERSEMLEDHGYQLRTRLRSGWTPSWLNTDLNPIYCEDSLSRCTQKVVDVIRLSDGLDVAIMNVPRQSRELKILNHLAEAQQECGRNHHVVPLLDSFQDERDPHLAFCVMPLLRQYDVPEFEVVSEVVELFKQLLEGMVFMHSVGVAHRGCSAGNIMMDAPSIFPNGFHPCDITKDRSGSNEIKAIARHKAPGPVQYYFVNFGMSRRYEAGEEHSVVADEGADRDVPEMSEGELHDPFPADIFILGKFFKNFFLSKHKNLTFASSLVDAMMSKEPAERPSAEEASRRLKSTISSQSYVSPRRRLVKKDEVKNLKAALYEDIGILANAALVPVKFTAGVPSRTIRTVREFVGSKLSKKRTS